MRNLLLLFVGIIFLAGCVSNSPVTVGEPSNYVMSCDALKYELADLGAKFEEAKDDSGFMAKNIGTTLLLWPGILVNETRFGKTQSLIDSRISKVSLLYTEKCRNKPDWSTLDWNL